MPSRKGFCLFLPDVVCLYVESDKPTFMSRCEECPHYKRFVRDMENEDQEFWDEVDRIRKYGESPYGRRYGRRE